jgi:hypothetical protein
MTVIAGDKSGSEMFGMLSGDNEVLEVGYDGLTISEGYMMIAAFDKFYRKDELAGKGKGTFTDNLKKLTKSNKADPDSDSIIIVSDWLDDPEWKKGRKGEEMQGFKWEKPLQKLSDRFGDRLFAVRLTSPDQTELRMQYAVAHDGRGYDLDLEGYLKIAEDYRRLGESASERIAKCLTPLRSLELSSEDYLAANHVTDFIFGN